MAIPKSTDTLAPEEKILAQAMQNLSNAESDHAVFTNRSNVCKQYWAGTLPGPTINTDAVNNDSNAREYVEPVLFRTVKAAETMLSDSFTEQEEKLAVKFTFGGAKKNPELERVVNATVNKYFHDNHGQTIFENANREVLNVGGVFPKVTVCETTRHDDLEVEDFTDVAVIMESIEDGWTIDPKAFARATKNSGKYKGLEVKESTETVVDQQTGEPVEQEVISVKGIVPLIKHTKKPLIELCEPEDLYFDTSYGDDFDKCRSITHKIKTTVGEAELMGFDPADLENATDEIDDEISLPQDFFSAASYMNPQGVRDRSMGSSSVDPKERPITLYETYLNSSLMNKKGESEKLQVIHTKAKALRISKVKRFPFVHGRMEIIMGQFFGRSLFDVAKPYQDILSLYMRISTQLGKQAAYPAWQAVKGQYDKESLMNSTRPGGVLEVAQIGAVERFAPQELPATFYNAYQGLVESSQQTLTQPVGAKSLDAGIPQVAAATVAMALARDSMKGMVVSKTVGRTLYAPLFELLYNIIRDEDLAVYDEAGEVVGSGKELPELDKAHVNVQTSDDDIAQTMQTQQLAMFVGQMSQINSPVLTPQNIYEMVNDACTKFDLDVSKFFTDPSSVQADPEQQRQEMEQKAIMSEMARTQLQIAALKVRHDAAEIYKIETETEELIRNNASERDNARIDSQAKIAKIQADAQADAGNIAVKNKQVNYDAILASHKHEIEINQNRANGIMG